MRARTLLVTCLVVGAGINHTADARAQTRPISDAECQSLRQRLGDHARLSDGVRRAVAAKVATAPATQSAVSSPAPPAGRAEAIRTRLQQIPKERQTLEDQRLAAMVKFELSRAGQIQGQIQALDAEKAGLEREQAALPAGSSAPAAPAAQPAAAPDVARIRCEDMPATLDTAVKIRRRELGAREDQAGVIPLTGLKGQTSDQIAQELAAQFAPGAVAMTQVGLLDSDGDGRLDGFVDVPAPSSFRLVRQRTDGTASVEVFPAPGAGTAPTYGEMARRLDEATIRQAGQTVADLVASRQAGPARAVTQTAEFEQARGQFDAGNFTDAGRIGAPVGRSVEFQNFRGENVRVMEIISAVSGGVSVRRVVVLARPNDQELWEETTTVVRPSSYWRSDVELARSRETRTTAGALVGARSTSAPVKFTVER
jgi:hypothetical protein